MTPSGPAGGLHVRIDQKGFGTPGRQQRVLSAVDLRVPPGRVTCLYGPSGCGKSTALRIAAGLDTEYSGAVTLDGAAVTGPTQRIGMVLQTPVAYEWLTVAGNLTFGLRYARGVGRASGLRAVFGGVDPTAGRAEAVRLAGVVGLNVADLDKYPDQISGGMRQRMAFGRALLLRPSVLLLDEPFSSLDFESREALQETTLRLRDELGTSFVCVSHDPEEVLRLADEVVVLGGTPTTVIHRSRPSFSRKGGADVRFQLEFQRAKQELQAWLDHPSVRGTAPAAAPPEHARVNG